MRADAARLLRFAAAPDNAALHGAFAGQFTDSRHNVPDLRSSEGNSRIHAGKHLIAILPLFRRSAHPDTAMASSLMVGVVALRPLRPRRAGGSSRYRPLADEACAPLCAARRLAARAVPPDEAMYSGRPSSAWVELGRVSKQRTFGQRARPNMLCRPSSHYSQWMQPRICSVSVMSASATSGWVRPTCARTLFWKARNWLTPDSQLPRSNEAQAALSEAMRGRLFRRSRSALSTAWMISSTASQAVMISTCTEVVRVQWPLSTMSMMS